MAAYPPTNLGPALGANSVPVVLATDSAIINVRSFCQAAMGIPTSTLTRPANTTAYATGQLIGSNTTAGSLVVPSVSTFLGGGMVTRVRLFTNATSGWNVVNLSVNLWSAAPTYTNGDGGVYAPVTGAAGWLGNFVLSLMQFGDGAIGGAGLTAANEMGFQVGSAGAPIYWDLQILSSATPISGQTFTIGVEVLS